MDIVDVKEERKRRRRGGWRGRAKDEKNGETNDDTKGKKTDQKEKNLEDADGAGKEGWLGCGVL
jgi:hypothetical protein